MVLVHVAEQGKRVPYPWRRGVLLDRGARYGRVAGAVGLGPRLHVVPPADVPGVHQPGDVAPGQVYRRGSGFQLGAHGFGERLDAIRPDDVVDTAHGGAVLALRRPGRGAPATTMTSPARTCDLGGRSSWHTPSSWGSPLRCDSP